MANDSIRAAYIAAAVELTKLVLDKTIINKHPTKDEIFALYTDCLKKVEEADRPAESKYSIS